MAEHEGFIKLNRNILRWRWINYPSTGYLFVIMLLKANYKEMDFDGKKIKPGQFVTSYPSLCKISGLTVQQCRTSIKRLKSTGEITVELYPKYQVITIVNYKEYQDVTGKTTGKQQASNSHLTVKQHQEKEYIKKGKEGERKEKNNSRSAPVQPYPCGVAEKPDWMTDTEWDSCKMKTTDDIPVVDRGYYDTYIEYAEAEHRGEMT